MPAHRIHSALEVLSIEEVEQEREGLALRHFSPDEYAEIAGRRAQTTAGFLAAKRALVRLFAEMEGQETFQERDFVLTHHTNGAPLVVSLPGDAGPGKTVHVSISHTRRFAYGLAVIEEGDSG
jgi:phosphopantetheinyl transferase (holo-ACP synthase)